MWASLDKFIPPELWNKSGKGGTVNDKIFTYLYAWVWSYHLPENANFKVELAKICWPSSLPAVPKKEAANSTCANTIAVTSTKHKLSLKTQGLLPTRELVFGLTRLDDAEILTMLPSQNRNLTVTVTMMSAAWVQKKARCLQVKTS